MRVELSLIFLESRQHNDMKKSVYKKILCSLIVALGFCIPNTSVFGLAVYESFVPEITLNDTCVPIITYSVTITPSTMTNGNYFVFALNKLNDQGAIAQSFDFPISIPANGVVTEATLVATGFSGTGTYTLRVIENASNNAFVGQTQLVELIPSAGTCGSAGGDTGADTTPQGDFSGMQELEIPIENPINITSIPNLIQKILEGLIKIGIPLLVVMIVYSGALYLFARGNSTKIGEAHTMLKYTLIGGAILLGAWALSELIFDTLIDLTASLIIILV